MKDPKDMSREELVTTLGIVAAGLAIYGMTSWADKLHEAATRLRNSIDRPTVCVEEVYNETFDNLYYRVEINGFGGIASYNREEWGDAETALDAALAKARHIRLALGMEGGEG